MNDLSAKISDIERRFENIISYAKISHIDYENQKLRLEIDQITTDFIPFPAHIGNNFTASEPLKIGIQVLIACPSGNFNNAVIIQILNDKILPSPSKSPDLDIKKFNDGTEISYNMAQKIFNLSCHDDAVFTIEIGKSKIQISNDGIILHAPIFEGYQT